jgi:paired amphipathic helix protein Sin3a
MGVGGGPTAAGMGEGPGSGSPHSRSHSSGEGECGTPTGELPPDAYYRAPSSLPFNMTLTDRTRQEANVTCTGRDEMCRAVLNDEWVSHPTWSSEDAGFVAHKKNIYEEALHRSEEERHEYDFHIEAATRTIAVLEPISAKIAQLPLEERPAFKLKPNLGGSGKAVHARVIKKIYGREAGNEVLQAMQDAPALAIPVVLMRLKEKEEEWKRAQREWNKVWREVDARNASRALDHAGIACKAADKKALSAKALVGQIEAARDAQVSQRAALVDPLFARARVRHQLAYEIADTGVLQDAVKMALSFLDRTQGQIGAPERRRVEGFLRTFVPLFFVLDQDTFHRAFVLGEGAGEAELGDDVDDAETSSVASNSGSGARRRKGAGVSSGGDLRKKLLKSEQAKSTGRKTRAQEAASPSASRPASPAIPDAMQVDSAEEGEREPTAPLRKASRKNVFFGNTVFYVLLRVLEVCGSILAVGIPKAKVRLATGVIL